MGHLLTGDFGQTFGGREISEIIAQAYPNTLKLALMGLLIEGVIGLTAGILTGLRRNGFLDNLVLVSTLFLLAIPTFVSGFLLQFVLGTQFRIIDPTVAEGAPFWDYLVPGFVLASISMAYVARLTRTSIAENSRSDYVRTAVAKACRSAEWSGSTCSATR
ncbi:ABC transporter permease [Phytohabitans flavus]|uniref:ABC transporter permease n=1 Tax=Phytohabitans flavus TaxID=1076124 RepID=UPI003628DA50